MIRKNIVKKSITKKTLAKKVIVSDKPSPFKSSNPERLASFLKNKKAVKDALDRIEATKDRRDVNQQKQKAKTSWIREGISFGQENKNSLLFLTPCDSLSCALLKIKEDEHNIFFRWTYTIKGAKDRWSWRIAKSVLCLNLKTEKNMHMLFMRKDLLTNNHDSNEYILTKIIENEIITKYIRNPENLNHTFRKVIQNEIIGF